MEIIATTQAGCVYKLTPPLFTRGSRWFFREYFLGYRTPAGNEDAEGIGFAGPVLVSGPVLHGRPIRFSDEKASYTSSPVAEMDYGNRFLNALGRKVPL